MPQIRHNLNSTQLTTNDSTCLSTARSSLQIQRSRHKFILHGSNSTQLVCHPPYFNPNASQFVFKCQRMSLNCYELPKMRRTHSRSAHLTHPHSSLNSPQIVFKCYNCLSIVSYLSRMYFLCFQFIISYHICKFAIKMSPRSPSLFKFKAEVPSLLTNGQASPETAQTYSKCVELMADCTFSCSLTCYSTNRHSLASTSLNSTQIQPEVSRIVSNAVKCHEIHPNRI